MTAFRYCTFCGTQEEVEPLVAASVTPQHYCTSCLRVGTLRGVEFTEEEMAKHQHAIRNNIRAAVLLLGDKACS